LRALAWFGALVLMLAMLATPPVQRTQEARVLQTAREMLGKGWRDWLIPHLNGQVRLEKPPLAYWLAAASFQLHARPGQRRRGPGCRSRSSAGLTLLLTWWIAKRFFGRRAAFYAAAMLLGSWMFARPSAPGRDRYPRDVLRLRRGGLHCDGQRAD
jgi:4-amino-4-deoxy-L-arabinose transferase-like glycosyltransferase